tara:strand:- start:428 stop:862 length:435 start_codon:yes stop_codon:yes gene_type:complete
MTSTTETILQAFATLVDNAVSAKFERNASVPEKIPAEGLVVLRDGNPGLPDEALGGFDNAYYEHEVEIEIYVADGAQNTRDGLFDDIVTAIGAALESDPDLGGLIFGMSYARPDVAVEIVPGSHAIKSGVLTLTLDYETPTPLS